MNVTPYTEWVFPFYMIVGKLSEEVTSGVLGEQKVPNDSDLKKLRIQMRRYLRTTFTLE